MGCNNSKGTTEGSAPAANSGQQEQPAATQASGEILSSTIHATSSFFNLLKKKTPIFRNSYFFFHDNLHVTGKRDEESNEFQITKILEELNYIVGCFFFSKCDVHSFLSRFS